MSLGLEIDRVGVAGLAGMSRADLEEALLSCEVPRPRCAMRARQIWGWLYTKGVRDFSTMSNLDKALRGRLAARFHLRRLESAVHEVSKDGTCKWLLRLGDGALIETVYIPDARRGTLCISSQVGCTLTCRFCHTGKQRLVRNLSCEEIVGQVLLARDALGDWEGEKRVLTHIVLMGMGEPLYNFENVKAALGVICDGSGLAISKRRVTLSTAGVAPMIGRVARETGVRLAVSLHAARDDLRSRLVPLNRKYSLSCLMEACRDYLSCRSGERITFEYVMLRGVNDSEGDARALLGLLGGLRAKVNLIPFNPWPGSVFEASSLEDINCFARIIRKGGYAAPVRAARGQDILAACGQLRSETQRHKKVLGGMGG